MPTPAELFAALIEGKTPRAHFTIREVTGGFNIEAATRYIDPITNGVVTERTGQSVVEYNREADQSARNDAIGELQVQIANWIEHGDFDGPIGG